MFLKVRIDMAYFLYLYLVKFYCKFSIKNLGGFSEYEYDKVIPLYEDILMEVDVKCYPCALEILNATTYFKIKKKN